MFVLRNTRCGCEGSRGSQVGAYERVGSRGPRIIAGLVFLKRDFESEIIIELLLGRKGTVVGPFVLLSLLLNNHVTAGFLPVGLVTNRVSVIF